MMSSPVNIRMWPVGEHWRNGTEPKLPATQYQHVISTGEGDVALLSISTSCRARGVPVAMTIGARDRGQHLPQTPCR